ncbi:MAG: TlpA family protein disulfide reductase [Gammaproteobacteria bacterium]|nr:TlpA family protein disulfide reductase [Gammaproteobacteria bacterium]
MNNRAGTKPVTTASVLLALLLLVSWVKAEPAKGKAPDFTLKSVRGDNLKLSERRGEVVMVNFWASWCKPCREEMPVLNELYLKYRDAGFTLWAINVEQNLVKAKRWLREVPVTFPVLFDDSNNVSKRYNVDAMPSTYLIDRDGNLRYLYQSYEPGYEDEYEKQIRELMRE